MLRKFFCVAIAALVMGAGSAQGSILSLTPETGQLDHNRFEVFGNINLFAADVEAAVNYSDRGYLAAFGSLVSLYKDNVDDGEENMPFKDNYTTTYDNDPDDPMDFMLTFDGGNFINFSKVYLVIKDGNANPGNYIFDISNADPGLGWDGMMTIHGTGFWPGQGAISHIEIFGAGVIPEPGTMTIWAVGCLAAIGAGRRRRS